MLPGLFVCFWFFFSLKGSIAQVDLWKNTESWSEYSVLKPGNHIPRYTFSECPSPCVMAEFGFQERNSVRIYLHHIKYHTL